MMKKNLSKKLLLICALLVLILLPIAAGEIKYINTKKIAGIENYSEELLFVINSESYVSSYVPDSYWSAPLPRAEYVTHLTALYDAMEAYPEPDNQEYLLLKGIICEYLYNLDETRFYLLCRETFNAVKELPSYDYRYLWFLGKLYTDASQITDGVKCFEALFNAIPREQLHPDVFLYSAYAYIMAQMPNNAIRDYETYERLSGISIQKDVLYQELIKNRLTYDSTGNNDSEPFQWRFKNGQIGFQTTPFGIWIACRDDWTIQVSRFNPGQYAFAASSPAFTTDAGPVTYTAVIISCLSQTIENTSAFSLYMQYLNDYDARQASDLVGGRSDISVIEWVNEDMYQNLGGAHCYAALIVRPYTDTADCDMEFPFEYDSKGSTSIHVLEENYKRYEGYVVTFVLMDSCEVINGQTEDDFVTLLELSDFY